MAQTENTEKRTVADEIADWAKTLGGAFLAYAAITTTAVAHYAIPSESMVPAIEVGDRVLVSKYAYGYSRHSLPLNLGALLPASEHRLFERLPERGDVVVFIHPQDGKVMIKRLIGLPGDVIEMHAGVLSINGEPAQMSEAAPVTRWAHEHGVENALAYDETLPNGAHLTVHHFARYNPFDDFGPYRVPEGQLFFMGDNRDNSLDSRWDGMGTAPLENLIGRAETIYWTGGRCVEDACPRARWMRSLRAD